MAKMNLLEALQESLDRTKSYVDAELAKKADKHNHSYLPLSGGTMTGVIATPNNAQGIKVGDDAYICDRNIADHMVIEGNTATNGGITFGSGKDTNIYRGGANLLKTDDTMNAVGGFQWNGQSLDNRYAAYSHGTHLTLGTGASNAYYGDKGKIAYDHSQTTHAPSNAQKNSDITKAEIEAKLTGAITTHTHSYLPLAGGTLTGDLTINKQGARLTYTNGTNSAWTGINVDGTQAGMYDAKNTKYIIAKNFSTGVVQINSNSATATLLDASNNTVLPGSMTVGNKVTMKYNATSESLDFIFI